MSPYQKNGSNNYTLRGNTSLESVSATSVNGPFSASLAVTDIDPKNAFTKAVGPKTLQGVPILFGYNARLDMPEDMVYKMVKTFYEKKDDLAKTDTGFAVMAKDFIGMQVQGINANPQIPVHPGLAKFLKEHKAWNDKWKVGSSST